MHQGAILDTARMHRGAIWDTARMPWGAILAVQGSVSRGAILGVDNIGWSDVISNKVNKMKLINLSKILWFEPK